jgi:hypothetical protein
MNSHRRGYVGFTLAATLIVASIFLYRIRPLAGITLGSGATALVVLAHLGVLGHSSVLWLRAIGDDGIRRLNKIAVSDRVRLEGLTQFRFSSRGVCLQTIGTTGHAESNMREGRFRARLFQTVRKSLILNGEMSEWSIEHAWKACVGETLPRVRIPFSPPIP